MACLWVERGKRARWLAVELTGDAWVLSTAVPTPLGAYRGNGSISRPTVLVRRGSAADAQWVLMAGYEANVRVNGSPMAQANRVLQDHDEILLGDAETGSWRRWFFSTSGTVTVEPFPANGDPACCPHCKRPILGGQSAVRCPACGLWHHEMSNGHSCWSLLGRCTKCHCRAPINDSVCDPRAYEHSTAARPPEKQ